MWIVENVWDFDEVFEVLESLKWKKVGLEMIVKLK